MVLVCAVQDLGGSKDGKKRKGLRVLGIGKS